MGQIPGAAGARGASEEGRKSVDAKMTRAEIVSRILGAESEDEQSGEEMIHLLLASKVTKDIDHRGKPSMGEHVADRIAKVAGSWSFIFLLVAFLGLWIIGNALLLREAYDPYPFILLNLFLSCVAALQAPVIMMSQNRQEQKDRLRAENDYRINLKSEIIVEDLHAKLEKLIENQERILDRLAALERRSGGDDSYKT
jgi:uncharacterized membrane protein